MKHILTFIMDRLAPYHGGICRYCQTNWKVAIGLGGYDGYLITCACKDKNAVWIGSGPIMQVIFGRFNYES